MKVLITATVQFRTDNFADWCSEKNAIKGGRELLADTLNDWPNDFIDVNIGPVQVTNLDSEDGSFPK